MDKETLSVKKGDVIMVRYSPRDGAALQWAGKELHRAFPNNEIVGIDKCFDITVLHKAVRKFAGKIRRKK